MSFSAISKIKFNFWFICRSISGRQTQCAAASTIHRAYGGSTHEVQVEILSELCQSHVGVIKPCPAALAN